MADYRIVLCGGGPIAQATGRLLDRMDFEVLHVAPYSDSAGRRRWEGVTRRIVVAYRQLTERLTLGRRDFVVITTRTLETDLDCLRQALRSEAGLIGLVSSRSRWQGILKTLRKEGVSARDLNRVRCPAGLEIGSVTADEIGLSIVAQLVQERAARLFGKSASKGRRSPAKSAKPS